MIIDTLLQALINRLERRLGVPHGLAHLRRMAVLARPLFFQTLRVAGAAGHHRHLRPDLHAIAGLVATAAEGCGACVQMAVNEASRRGVPAADIAAALSGRFGTLPPELADTARFARAVVNRDANLPALRSLVLARFGEAALLELANAVATARVFPVLKRGLGLDDACMRVEVPGTEAANTLSQAAPNRTGELTRHEIRHGAP